MAESRDFVVRGHPVATTRQPTAIAVLAAAAALVGCGDVAARPDAAQIDGNGGDAALNRCAPDACLLSDEFTGPSLNTSLWRTSVGGGATVTQGNGVLTLRIPAAADAFVDVSSLVGFPVGTTFEASVTFSANQFYDHKGVGFASSRVDAGCDSGETEAAMFRGQDNDGYMETKSAGVATCTMTVHNYPGGTSTVQISRMTDQVVFRQNNTMFGPIKSNLPTGLLPVRFSAYTYTIAPMQPVQIDVDYVIVRRP